MHCKSAILPFFGLLLWGALFLGILQFCGRPTVSDRPPGPQVEHPPDPEEPDDWQADESGLPNADEWRADGKAAMRVWSEH